MDTKDIRWLQRYESFHKAFQRIIQVTASGRKPAELSELEKEGRVQRFEYTFELAWKVLQDLLLYRGYEITPGPNPVLKKSFEDGLITDHDGWRKMMKARNATSHTCNEGEARLIVDAIYQDYAPLFDRLDKKLAVEVRQTHLEDV